MTLFVGLDVSVKETAVCVVDDTGKVVCEQIACSGHMFIRLLVSVSPLPSHSISINGS